MTVITTNIQPVSDSNSESHSNGNRVEHIVVCTCSSSELNDYGDQAVVCLLFNGLLAHLFSLLLLFFLVICKFDDKFLHQG